jgi:hypothetical protein
VVNAARFERDWSVDAQPVGRRLAGPSVCDDFEFELLPFVEGAQARSLDCADVNEHILAAVVRLNEAKALLAVEPLYSARTHENFLSLTVHRCVGTRIARLFPDLSILEKCLKRARPSRQAKRPSRSAKYR